VRVAALLPVALGLLLAGCVCEPGQEQAPPQVVRLDLPGTWGPGAVSSGAATGGSYQWHPEPLPQVPENRSLARLNVTLTWTNTPTAFADLGLGVGEGSELKVFRDGGRNTGFGPQNESFTFTYDELASYGLTDPHALALGPATGTGFVAPGGLSYRLGIEATYEGLRTTCDGGGSNDNGGSGVGAPALPAVPVAAAVVAAALLARRRAVR